MEKERRADAPTGQVCAPAAPDVEALRRRCEELECQNRALRARIAEIEGHVARAFKAAAA